MTDVVRIRPEDMVAVALKPLEKGVTVHVDDLAVTLTEDIPMGHKIALCPIAEGEKVIKYGFPIGVATAPIAVGEHVHTHNLHTGLSGAQTYEWKPTHPEDAHVQPLTFQGYRRANGKVGIRNEIWILPTVGCVNDVAEAIARKAQKLVHGPVEGVYVFGHPYGCSQLGEDQENTRNVLADLACHPNAGGVLLLGLGCENSGIREILPRMKDADMNRVRTLICQESEDEVTDGLRLVEELAAQMADDKRTPCDTSDLIVGLKCGGSDGLSGITANPTIGGFSDRLIARGGSTILTEVPEMFGAETILMGRCEDEETYGKTVSLINNFKNYFESAHQPVYENPSPGNKAGGITTLEDKALGCTQKSGKAPVRDVLTYSQRVTRKGLNLLSAPGNDLVASTALAAAGAQLVLFSTGRGTPFGCPVPTLKISSNSALAAHKHTWIDYNAGALVDGTSLDTLADGLLDLVLAVANGKQTRNEINGFRSLAIFKTGVTL